MKTNNLPLTTNEVDMHSEVVELRECVTQLRVNNERAEGRYRHATHRARLQAGLAFAVLSLSICLSPGSRAAFAQGYGITLQELANRVKALETSNVELKNRTSALETSNADLKTRTSTLENKFALLIKRTSELENKTQFMSASASEQSTTFTGCNVYVQNGLGATNGNPNDPKNAHNAHTNGVGNLIIGYNLTGNSFGDQRGGSHNLVLGDCNNYVSYGGMVAGFSNVISGDYATVTGGAQCIASGEHSHVSGGLSNLALGQQSSVSGGGQNSARGVVSSVSGGVNNVAVGFVSTISGGFNITLNNDFGWAAAGLHFP